MAIDLQSNELLVRQQAKGKERARRYQTRRPHEQNRKDACETNNTRFIILGAKASQLRRLEVGWAAPYIHVLKYPADLERAPLHTTVLLPGVRTRRLPSTGSLQS